MSFKAWRCDGRGVWLAICVVVTACAGPTELSPGEPPPTTVQARDARPVIVVVVDTLRADHLGIHGHGRRTTPNLDAWASQGRVYDRAFATAPWTLPSFGSIYTGLWPAVHRAGTLGDRWLRGSSPNRLSTSVQTLAEVLRDRGFETGAVMNNPFLEASFGVARGFDVYDHVPGDNQNVRRADEMVARALDLIDSWADRPFFLVLHLFDPHMDYDAPEPVRGTFANTYPSQLSLPIAQLGEFRRQEIELTSNDVEFVRAAYDEEVLFVDQQIGALRQGLSTRELIDDTLVLLTSDHGEELFDHGGFEHGHAMWQEVVRVPLVVWGPDVRPGREAAPVSLVDVMPTVLDWLSVEPPVTMDGVSLRPNLVDEVAIAERALFADSVLYGPPQTAVIRWPFKMIVDAEDTPVSLVDLEADPSEKHNVLAARPDVVATLAADLYAQRKVAARARAAVPDEQASPGEEIIERLRSLGYVR